MGSVGDFLGQKASTEKNKIMTFAIQIRKQSKYGN